MHLQRIFFLLPLLLALLLGVSCNEKTNENSSKQDNKLLHIVTTTGMIGDAVKNVVKDKAKISSLMGPGVDPHLYKATQGDLKVLTDADLIFYNGLLLEGKMEGILEKMGKAKPVQAVSTDIPQNKLLVLNAGTAKKGKVHHDPHIWFDVTLWQKAVQKIADVMQKQDPDNADFYAKNTENYLSTLQKLHTDIKQKMATIPKKQRVLITSHDAFSYFGKAYDIEVKGLQGVSTVSAYGLKDVTNMVDFVIDRKIKALFVESSVSSKSIEAVLEGCKKRKHPTKLGGTLFADAMGEAGTPEGTYIGMVNHNVNRIWEALK